MREGGRKQGRKEGGKKRIRKMFYYRVNHGNDISVFSDLGFSFCRYFRLPSLYYSGMRIFIWTVGKLQNFFGFCGCGYFFLNT